MAARSSVVKDRIPRRLSGHISVVKTATPRDKGTAITNARRDETIVPYMKGNAPYWSSTGFQSECQKNFQPKACQESSEPIINWYTIRPRSATTASPHRRITVPKNASGISLTFPCNKGMVLASIFRAALGPGSGSGGALKRGRGRA